MKKIGLMMLTLGALSFTISSADYNKVTKDPLNKTIIVSLNVDPFSSSESDVKASQEAFRKALHNYIGFNYEFVENYTKATNAMLLRVNEDKVSVIENMPLVSSVTEDKVYRFADMTNSEIEGADYNVINESVTLDGGSSSGTGVVSNNSLDTMNVPTSSNKGAGTLVAVLDSGFYTAHNAFQPLDASKVKYTEDEITTLINKAGDSFYAKSDTTHSTYINSKIPFAYDYGGTVYTENDDSGEVVAYYTRKDGKETKYTSYSSIEYVPDFDAYSPYSEHGTHVAGIIAGNDPTYQGVAPDAQLALMKVFTDNVPLSIDVSNSVVPSTGANDSVILKALNDALALNVDVLNMSLGQDLDDFDGKSESFKVFKKLKENGTICSVSAGNNGRQLYNSMGPYAHYLKDFVDNGTLGSYANSEDVMTIGSGNLEIQHYDKAFIVGSNAVSYDDQATKERNDSLNEDLPFSMLVDSIGSEIEYVYIDGFGETADFEKTFPEGSDARPLANKICVVDRGGGVAFTTKIINAITYGASGVIIVNNDPGATDFNMRMDFSKFVESITVPVAMVLQKDRNNLKNASNKVLSIAANTDRANANIGKMSEFSTDGATYDLRIKPDITAPGSAIRGPVPGDKTDYTTYEFIKDKTAYKYLSGTSMSAPNYSGAVALLISENNTGTKEETKAYKDTIPMRTMSTAKVTSSKTGYVDLSKDSDEGINSLYSPRRSGSGMVDVGEALKSKIYLEGTTEKKAKVELYNNEDIAQGNIKFSFKAHSELTSDVKYKASIFVLKPDTVTYTEEVQPGNDPEFPEYMGKEFQSIEDKLIKKVDLGEVVIKGNGETVINVSTSLTTEEKAAIEEKFPNGTYLEGYVYLSPVDTSKTELTDLNIPYMGFYGDYFAQEPVEPFDFEKEEGKVYGSDLLNTLAKRLSLVEADYGSYIGAINIRDIFKESAFLTNMQQMWLNNSNIKKITTPINKVDGNKLYVGASGTTSGLFIQLYVNRAINNSNIELIGPDGKDYALDVLGEDAKGNRNHPRFYDPLLGASTDGLAKSFAGASWLGGLIAHRAHAFIPLTKVAGGSEMLDSGEYTLKMTFTYQASATGKFGETKTFTKEVKIIIDSESPEITKVEITKVKGTEYLRVYFKEDYLYSASFNGGFIGDGKFTKVSNGSYYAEVKLSEIKENSPDGKVYLEAVDAAYGSNKYLFNVNNLSKGGVLFNDTSLTPGYSLTEEITDKVEGSTLTRTYSETLLDANGKEISLSKSSKLVTVSVKDFKAGFKVYRILASGLTPEITNYTLSSDGQTISIRLRDAQFKIVGQTSSSYSSNKKGCGGSVITSSIVLSSLALGGLATTLAIRKKKKTK